MMLCIMFYLFCSMVGWIVQGFGRMMPQPVPKPKEVSCTHTSHMEHYIMFVWFTIVIVFMFRGALMLCKMVSFVIISITFTHLLYNRCDILHPLILQLQTVWSHDCRTGCFSLCSFVGWRWLRQTLTQLLFSFCFRGEGLLSPLNKRRRRLGDSCPPHRDKPKRSGVQ